MHKTHLGVPTVKNQTTIDEEEAETFMQDIQGAAWNNTKEYVGRTAGNNYPIGIRELVKS